MEGKFRAYRSFDWTTDSRWQMYLENLYPTPDSVRLERIRRRWYKDNVDRDFDINYVEGNQQQSFNSSSRNNQNNQPQNQQQQQQSYQQQRQQQQNRQQRQNQPDVVPHMDKYQCIAWLLFLVTFIPRIMHNLIAIAALFLGLVRRYGPPQLNEEYILKAMRNDNFQGLLYMMILIMVGHKNIVMYVPLIMIAFLESVDFALAYLRRNPNTPVLGVLKEPLEKAILYKQYITELKAEIEVYMGIYLIVVWFLRRSNLYSILFYLQLLRIRYMLLDQTQAAFKKLDGMVRQRINSATCPQQIKNAYQSTRRFCVKMGAVEEIRNNAMFFNCNIF